MPNESRENDPRNIWQNQPTEPSTMTLEKIRQRARQLRAKTRRALLGTLAGPLAAVFFCAFDIAQFPRLQHALAPLCGFALVWSLVGLYFLNRGMWSAVMPGDAGFSTGLEFCRREIERQRSLLSRVLLWSFGPVLLAIGSLILALALAGSGDRGIFPNGLPFLILVAVWIIGYFLVRLREQRELQHEIDELNDIEAKSTR